MSSTASLLRVAPLFAPVRLVKVDKPYALDLVRQFGCNPSGDLFAFAGVAAITGTYQRTVSKCAVNPVVANAK
jgi:hypothetical protein